MRDASGLRERLVRRNPPCEAAPFALILTSPTATVPAELAESRELNLADISVPPELYASPALDPSLGPLFHRADVIRLR